MKLFKKIKDKAEKHLNKDEKAALRVLNLIKIISPIIIPYIVLAIAFIIIIIGILRSILLCDWIIFQRAGALIVVLSLWVALLDHSNMYKKLMEFSFSTVGEETLKPDILDEIKSDINKSLEKHGVSKNENEIDWMADFIYTHYKPFVGRSAGNLSQAKALQIEIFLAAIGTLIWGFGDLIGFVCL